MAEIRVLHKVLGAIGTNVYLAVNEETQEALLIDPADRADLIAAWVKQAGVSVKGILLTHGHFDHMYAAMEVKKEFQAPIYAMEAERVVLEDANLNLSGSWAAPKTCKADVFLKDAQEIELAGMTCKAYLTPGHTKGGACFYFEDAKIMFSGDTIFCESIGRTDFPTGSHSELVRSVRRMLELVPEETKIYPGHMSMTTAAHEVKYNPYI